MAWNQLSVEVVRGTGVVVVVEECFGCASSSHTPPNHEDRPHSHLYIDENIPMGDTE